MPATWACTTWCPAAISVSQATEWGTVYARDELAALAAAAHAHGLVVHMDGARFGNAVAHLGCTPAEASWKCGVDVLSFGATKNGALAAEAVMFFRPELAREFELRRKRAGHLWSKHALPQRAAQRLPRGRAVAASRAPCQLPGYAPGAGPGAPRHTPRAGRRGERSVR